MEMNMTSADKCREQFEAWWESFHGMAPRESWSELHSSIGDYYMDEDIDSQYDAWKASRVALEIALPVLEQQERGEGDWIEWCGRSIPRAVRGRTVQVRYACGETTTEYSGFLNWGDGVARLSSPTASSRSGPPIRTESSDMGEWIKCCERLPEETKDEDGGATGCLVLYEKGREPNGGYNVGVSNVVFLRRHWQGYFSHWQPLPPPPEDV